LRIEPELAQALNDPRDLFYSGVRLRDNDHMSHWRNHENAAAANFLQAQILMPPEESNW
jgi:hypothetical protein